MNVNLYCISTSVNIPLCISIEDIQMATQQDADVQRLKSYIIQGQPHKKDEVEWSMKYYWAIRHEVVMVDGIAMKGKRVIILSLLCRQILEQLYSNHMDIEKMRLFARELVYWGNMNADIENLIKQCATCLKYQQTQPQEKTLPYEVPYQPWELVGTDKCFC